MYNGECATDASLRLGGDPGLVSRRLKLGWSIENAFSVPKQQKSTNLKERWKNEARQEERARLREKIKDSLWQCPLHEEVNPVENKGCGDCSEAASVNIIINDILSLLDGGKT